MPNLSAMQRNINGPDAVGGICGPSTGSGENGRSAPNGNGNHNDNNAEDSTFLSTVTPYSTNFHDKLISFGIQSNQVCTLMMELQAQATSQYILIGWH